MEDYDEDARYLRIGILTRGEDLPSEDLIRQSLQTTFMSLGGITRAGTQVQTLGAIKKTSGGEKQCEFWICVHRGDCAFIKGSLPAYTATPNSTIVSFTLLEETQTRPS